MGIPYYFYTLTKSYNDIISSNTEHKCDIYLMDFNGIIHPACAKLLEDLKDTEAFNTEEFEDRLIKALHTRVMADIDMLNPKKVYICVDGVVPIAKMIQQRKRRYLSIYKQKLDNQPVKWDTNSITPGTNFMKKLNSYFTSYVQSADIYYSGSDEFGEGEHKIFQILKDISDDMTVTINGLDADLIILSLMSQRRNLHLMRENQGYLNIDNLKNAIIRELTQKWELAEDTNINDLIESYCVMCSLLGNDFLPHLLTLNLKSQSDMNALDKLIQFAGQSFKLFGLLINDSTINSMALYDILQNIAKTEDKDLFEDTQRYLRNNAPHHQIGDYYGLKNKDKLASQIYSSQLAKWRQLYYKALFHTNILIDSTVINNACKSYIDGIFWTYNYYKRRVTDYMWYYPYGYPPTAKDIANYTLSITAREDSFAKADVPADLTTDLQMLIVLPIESISLFKEEYKSYLTDISKGLHHLYPKHYKIHTYLKTHLWECIPELPIINVLYIIELLKNTYIK